MGQEGTGRLLNGCVYRQVDDSCTSSLSFCWEAEIVWVLMARSFENIPQTMCLLLLEEAGYYAIMMWKSELIRRCYARGSNPYFLVPDAARFVAAAASLAFVRPCSQYS